MTNPQMVMYEEEFNQIQTIVDRLVKEANAQVVFIIDKNGQLIAKRARPSTSTRRRSRRSPPATSPRPGGMAKLLKENEFATQFHEGEKANIHIQLVGQPRHPRGHLRRKTSLGLVRLRVKKASEELNLIFEALLQGAGPQPGDALRRDHRRRHRQPLQRLGS
jgi:predicted regulator of Ras-like GTPase activity (Roadblock/LC7/MglB family)